MQNYPLDLLSSELVQNFIFENETLDPRDFVLRHREFGGVSAAIIADQLLGRQKSKWKIPEYYSTRAVIYPPTVNLEQSSSSATARFKIDVALKSTGRRLAVDLTGGFGVDTLFLSLKFERVIYVEPDANLLGIAQHNHSVFGANNIEYRCLTAEDFLVSFSESADVFFIDPSRRVRNKKVSGMKDSIPDITKIQPRLLKTGSAVLVKASPLMDIKAALSDLMFVREVFVLSVDNDCKELLFLSLPDQTPSPEIHAVNIEDAGIQTFSFHFKDEEDAKPRFSFPSKYLYEPNVSILKAGAFKLTAGHFDLSKLDPNSHLYTSPDIRLEFPGRIFQVDGLVAADASSAGQFFPRRKANIIARNYPLTVDGLKSKLKLIDGGERYLIATTSENKKLLIAGTRIK